MRTLMSAVNYRHFTGNGAENYERDFLPAIAIPVSAELLRAADLQPGDRVLDIGCGTGLIARCAAETVGATGSVAGIDVSPDMIAVATSLPIASGASIEWREGDATALPFADESFDVVLCQMTLMFIEDRLTALREANRVLARGGRLLFSTPGAIQPAFELLEQSIVEHISADLAGFVSMVFSMHDPQTHCSLLRDTGFEHVESKIYRATFDLPAPAEFLWQYINLTPMGPFVAKAPEAAKNAMEAQVSRTWAPYLRNGRTPVEQPMVLASGMRSR
jgi:ubiquinone/menaquinone biosynthesis C-methylase UbiE